MKKTVIALASLLSSVAFAQSNVTFSGAVDVGIEKAGSGSPVKVESGRSSNTFFRIAGVEDLGGGLKANFFLQTVVSADTGNTSSVGNDGAFVGLSGAFGAVNLGKSLNPLFLQALGYTANNTKGVSGFSTLGDGYAEKYGMAGDKGTLNNGGVTVNNQITYTTPNFSGLTATVAYAPAEGNGKNHRAVTLQYADGPLMVALGHGTRPVTLASAGTDIVPVQDKLMTQIGVAYDFGVARATFLFQKDRNYEDSNAFALGVTVPVSTGSVWASFDRRDLANNENVNVLQLGYKHNLSKRTHLYVNFGTRDKSWDNMTFNGSEYVFTNAVTRDKRSTGYGVGINHTF